jgi:hypothetical protein
MKNTYWNSNGKFQAFAEHLRTLVPIEGEVPNKRKNPALEKFRKASNCYYDLYNNGLWNRAREFYGVFKIASGNYKYLSGRMYGPSFMEELYVEVEAKMDEIVLAAMDEQVAHANAAARARSVA